MTTRWTNGIDWARDGDQTDETAGVTSAEWMPDFQQANPTIKRGCKRLWLSSL